MCNFRKMSNCTACKECQSSCIVGFYRMVAGRWPLAGRRLSEKKAGINAKIRPPEDMPQK